MRLRSSPSASHGWSRSFSSVGSLFSAALLLTPTLVRGDGPKLSMKTFEHPPVNLQYFDDSDVIMFQDWSTNTVYRSPDAGVTWAPIKDAPDGKEWNMYMHPFDSKRAYVLTEGSTHWKTSDRGETWKSFFTDATPSAYRATFTFHAGDPDRIIFNGEDCTTGIFCEEIAMYTTDGFENTHFLRADTRGCSWAKSTDLFTTGQADLDRDRILCITTGKYSIWEKDHRLLISDNFFTAVGQDIQEFEPDLEDSRVVNGLSEMAFVKKYLVAAARATGTDEMALYVSDDTVKWHRAIFPHDHKLEEKGYTVLEGTNYSIQIDVMTTRPLNPMGVLLSSNSNGTYFTRLVEHTNRSPEGFVDFEKMAGIQGIIMVNVVDNYEELQKSAMTRKKIKSQISFDDGRTWQPLTTDKQQLHLHSVTEMDNVGRIFSSPAPGIVMGIGNTGEYLKDFNGGDTYVSDDAGLTWTKALDGPHKYEFGDQGSILLAVKDEMTDKFKYSLDHGKSWKEGSLPEKMLPLVLTTTMDSTSLKFIMIATDDPDARSDFRVLSFDFNEMQERKCDDKDMEKWYARVDEKGEATCIMGHTQFYRRRKADADCFVKSEFQDPMDIMEFCPCTDADFECDFNFVRSDDRKECILKGPLVIPAGECKGFDAETIFQGSSGWRLIPGNDCKRSDGPQKDDTVARKCAGTAAPPASGKISSAQEVFKGKDFVEKVYLERSDTSQGDDETVIMRTTHGSFGEIFLSHDAGKKWTQILKEEKIEYILRNQYFNDVVYFIADGGVIFYSTERGENIRKFGAKTPTLPDIDHQPMMSFHPKHKDWIIWMGVKDCDGGKKTSGDCHAVASLTTDRGDNWKTLQRYVRKCEFIKDNPPQRRDEKLIYCGVRTHESSDEKNNPWKLVSSSNFFEEEPVSHFDDIMDFATMDEFIVVAAKDEKHNLKIDASVDGSIFAEAKFPANFQVPVQSAYTVMDSSTHAVFLHVTVDKTPGAAYGSIIKSNSNGTSYVLSLSGVNRDAGGYVDFEKMYGLEGVALVNVVSNYETVTKDGKKLLKTQITHNDGAEWGYLPPPTKDVDGKSFSCSGDIKKCSLHVHGYTERMDKSKTYSSPTAIGMMMAVGDVGEYLTPYSEADTYVTTDAGISWRQVKKGTHMWEYGDQGSIIVLVKDKEPTNIVSYSLDEGITWADFEFSVEKVRVKDITTVPSDNSRNFILWTESGDGVSTINIDFSGLTDRQCKLDENQENADYFLWTPVHPNQDDDCLFGHVSQYHRKRSDAECYNGRTIQHIHNIARTCACTRRDFECDYNYEMQSDGSCAFVQGLPKPNHAEVCSQDPSLVLYYEPTGYRHIPLDDCEGGRELEYIGVPKPCPGKEDQFERERGISGIGLFFAIIIPIAAAVGVGFWVFNNWTSHFGQIRLGESTFDDQAPYIKYPVVAVSAIVALIITLPSLLGSLWSGVSKMLGRRRTTRYTTRSSFARESDYAAVDEDDAELLGDDSDEEV